ncbi:MAG: prepilin-type N-terminal cleavage/methylation domain-containing protein [Candidatus Eisenbacteria bacterium]|uniref:Prepilin-type N-terminal cleavage/methylation domain-containing protein n=1 Tax=Eiseniibacteriota bacterium TaxID=2212470 RepID=A0A948WER0_UNCEI|nr:prepilin-type N-terminal cleavage/methylation domain-containing protein [Candidatus Eisenbacteria bacterium]MBU2692993.1 prepilin-type N-terminal cleavage/methylation domain-containing protein [Candidatus Eisenbacteria bacterium]
MILRQEKWSEQQEQRGFTLVEVMVTVVVIGILTSMAIPNYIRLQERAKTAQCMSNQKNISTAATAYGMDNGIIDASVSCLDLFNAGLISSAIAECPSSENSDNDDYEITFVGGVPVAVTCLIAGPDHLWETN